MKRGGPLRRRTPLRSMNPARAAARIGTTDFLAKRTRARSGGRCEAWWPGVDEVYERCRNAATERHHRLLKSRGGLLLDLVYPPNLVHVCDDCHRRAHRRDHDRRGRVFIDDREGFLIVRGRIRRRPCDRAPYYCDGVDTEYTAALAVDRDTEEATP